MHTPARILLVTLCLAASLRAEDAKPKPAEETVTIAPGELQVLVETDGNLDSANRKKIKIQPQEYFGPYTVLDVTPNGQHVEKDAPLLKLDTSGIERMLRSTRENLDANLARLPQAREEFENLKAGNKIRWERATYDLSMAERDRNIFTKFGEEQMVKGREVALKQWQNHVADREEELEQLESMYKETKLATQTKEIVLERSRRSLEVSKVQLDLTVKGDRQMREYDLPTRKEQILINLDHRKKEHELLKASIRLGESAKSDEIVRLERSIRDSQEYLARLESDLPRLNVTAPIAGMLQYRGIDPGDKVSPNGVLMEVLDTENYEVRFQVLAKDFRALKLGQKVIVRVPDMPELELDGKVDEIAFAPTSDDKGVVRFAAKARLDKEKVLRPGLRARVEIHGEKLKHALTLARNQVINEDNRTYVKVREGDKVEKKEIVLGLGNKDRAHVVKGLKEGDVVVIEKK